MEPITQPVWPVWLNGWVFVYALSGCGLESKWLNVRFWTKRLWVRISLLSLKIVNGYIAFEFDTLANIPASKFKLKNCLFGATNIVKKWMHSGYEIAFDGAVSWNYDNDLLRML